MSEVYPDENEYIINIDVEKLGARLQSLQNQIQSKVFGQERAIEHAIRRLAIYEAGLSNPLRPVGAMIFAGPTGVGKTYAGKVIAESWIGVLTKEGRSPAVIIECGNLAEHHNIQSLIGAPHSYIGFDRPPIFGPKIKRYHIEQIIEKYYKDPVERTRRRLPPDVQEFFDRELYKLIEEHHDVKSVIIFDEIEKAHPLIWNILLNILEEGKITLADGSETSFSNTLFILTTNIGSREIRELIEGKVLGFKPVKQKIEKSNGLDQEIYERTKRSLEKEFPPELLSRLAREIIVFRTLEYKHYLQIMNVFLNEISQEFSGKPGKHPPLSISYSEEFKKFLIEEGVDPRYGARALRAAVEKHIIFNLAQAILNDELRTGDRIRFSMEDGKPLMKRTRRPGFVKLKTFKKKKEKPPFDLEGILIRWGLLPPRSSPGSPVAPPAPKPPGRKPDDDLRQDNKKPPVKDIPPTNN